MVRQAAHPAACAVRFTSADADAQTRERLLEAFARGDFATWPYGDERAKHASDPAAILAGAKSVVCIAVAYATKPPKRAPLAGRVSNYAWSHDYHARMRSLLLRVARHLDDAIGAPVTAVACDTKPIAERAFAARSGLGWIGKHTNLIAPSLGSYVYLGEIVTTLALQADAPLVKSCGACARCVQRCPTGALRGDYTIDATRCISDLTQRKDGIPRALRPLVGQWVWGCDICQEVCPPTQQAAFRGSADDEPASGTSAAPDLVRLLRMRGGEFRRDFAATAMGWRGAAVLRRNAAVALGNALDRSTVPALLEALQCDRSAMVRGHVAWALGRIGSRSAIDGLRTAAQRESNRDVREEIDLAVAAVSSAHLANAPRW
ncbi:MAG: tRNA epoxyqueuosine(34) reductase QueG [Candidatus Tyrphobacter sp.]